MKKIILLSLFACIFAGAAQAQIVTSTNLSVGKVETVSVEKPQYNHIYFSIDSPALTADAYDENLKFNSGFSLGFTSAQQISDSMPMFLEYGVGLSHALYNERYEYDEYESESITLNFFSAGIPINAVYLLTVNDNFTIAPYAGLYARYGLSFTGKSFVEDHDECYSDSYNYYSKDEMGSDYVFKRLTFGYQLGVNIQIKDKYVVGVKLQNDMSQMNEYCKYQNGVSFNLGLKF